MILLNIVPKKQAPISSISEHGIKFGALYLNREYLKMLYRYELTN